MVLNSRVEPVRSDIDKCGARAPFVEKDKQHSEPRIDGDAPDTFEFAVQFMRSQPAVERVALEQGDPPVRDSPHLRVKPVVAALESRIENNVHALRSEEREGNLPTLPRRRASRAQRRIFFSVTSSPARSISASSSFFGMTTRSSLAASFLGMVIVAIHLQHTTWACFHACGRGDRK